MEMAEKKKRSAVPLIVKKIEEFPVELANNKLYTTQLLQILDKNVRRDPVIYALYNHGKLVWIGSTEGIVGLKSMVLKNMKKKTWDRFALYSVSNRKYIPDLVALASRLALPAKAAGTHFTRAQNAADEVKRGINKWTGLQIKGINRTLKPTVRKYNVWTRRFDVKENRIRKGFGKRIDRAKDQVRQKAYRVARDKKLKELSKQRAKLLQPLRKSIGEWQSKMRSFEKIRF